MTKRGFTLVEILVYIIVLAIIVLAVSSFFIWAVKSNTKAKVMRETVDNAQRSMEIMIHDIKEAKSIYTPTSASTQLSLETTHYLPSEETSTFIDFFLCGADITVLCSKKEGQSVVALTSDRVEVNNLEFILISTTTPSVQINLGINYKNPGGRPEYQSSIDFTSTASLRSP